MVIDLESKIPGCANFYWYEFLWLPSWKCHVYPPNNVAQNLIQTALKMELVRAEFGGHAVHVTSGYRPAIYNKYIRGAEFSAHKAGEACDFVHSKLTAQECRERLEPLLEKFSIRMEKLPHATWVHIDIREPINYRYFIP